MAKNSELSQIFEEMSRMSEILDDNPFKARTYARVSRIIFNLKNDIEIISKRSQLTSIDGIGDKIAAKIDEFLQTGEIGTHKKMYKSIPSGVWKMLSIRGLGPRRAGTIWRKMGITTVKQLEKLCLNHRLKDMPSFSRKTEDKILKGIAALRQYAGKHLLIDALAVASAVKNEIKKWDIVKNVDIAGSIRRHVETVQNINIVVATTDSDALLKKLSTMRFIETILKKDKHKLEASLFSGIICRMNIVSPDEYPFALAYFTGSKEHNAYIKTIADKKGLKISKSNMFKKKTEKAIKCKSERNIFKKLDMQFIEPELRENMGEVDAALKKKLPDLVKLKDMKGLFHVHSTYTDGKASIMDTTKRAIAMGYQYVAICDHSQAVTIASGMHSRNVMKQHAEIDKLNKELSNFRILKGIEVDIMPDGSLDYDNDLLSKFELVIASIHSKFGMSKMEMTERIIRGISNPFVDILAHPTGRLLLKRKAYAIDMKKVIAAAVKYSTALEINAHPMRLDLDWRWCKYAKDAGVKFAIGCDAHNLLGLEDVEFGIWTAQKGWLKKTDILNSLSCDELMQSLNKSH